MWTRAISRLRARTSSRRHSSVPTPRPRNGASTETASSAAGGRVPAIGFSSPTARGTPSTR